MSYSDVDTEKRTAQAAGVAGQSDKPRRGLRARRRRNRMLYALTGAGLVLVFFVSSLGGALWIILRGVPTDMPGPVPIPRPGQRINVLFLGLDADLDSAGRVQIHTPLRESRSRTDTMILVSVDPVTHETSLISIPRDTRAYIPGFWWDKINSAHVWGGPLAAMQAVEELLQIPVHYYVRTDYHGVEAVVNVLGGVEVDVEFDMRYSDPCQDLEIDLKRGLQTLDGDMALQYVRYRNGGGDIYRIGRQQNFISALVKRVLSFGTVFRAQALAREVVKYIDTNMTSSQIFDFAWTAARVGDPQIEMAILPGRVRNITDPGRPALSYWVINEDETADIIDRLVWGIDKEKNAGISVRVLNGTDVTGLAADVAGKLRVHGFDVVEIGNAEGQGQATTHIVDHTDGDDPGQLVARSVMRYATDFETYRDVNEEAEADVTVVVGKDFTVSTR